MIAILELWFIAYWFRTFNDSMYREVYLKRLAVCAATLVVLVLFVPNREQEFLGLVCDFLLVAEFICFWQAFWGYDDRLFPRKMKT